MSATALSSNITDAESGPVPWASTNIASVISRAAHAVSPGEVCALQSSTPNKTATTAIPIDRLDLDLRIACRDERRSSSLAIAINIGP